MSEEINAMRMPQQTKRSRQRDGIVLIAALICLMISSLAVANIFQMVRSQRRQATQRGVELQASWLADAGIRRAIAQLAVDPAYDGENWRIDVPFSRAATYGRPASNSAGNVGQVRITVERNGTELQHLAVVAEYPLAAPNQVRKSIDLSISTESLDDQSN
jgi:type II secretory pathway component PulK